MSPDRKQIDDDDDDEDCVVFGEAEPTKPPERWIVLAGLSLWFALTLSDQQARQLDDLLVR